MILKTQLGDILDHLNSINLQRQLDHSSFVEIFRNYELLTTEDKRHLIKLIPPAKVDFLTGELTLELNESLFKILMLRKM